MPQAVANRRLVMVMLAVGKAREALLRVELGSGVGGQRVDRIVFGAGLALGETVHTATGREDKVAHAGVRREPRQAQAGGAVDTVRCRLELLAHRIIRDGGQMHHGVGAVQKLGRQIAHVAEVLLRQQRLGKQPGGGKAVREIPGVEADQLRVGKPAAQMPGRRRGRHIPCCRL